MLTLDNLDNAIEKARYLMRRPAEVEQAARAVPMIRATLTVLEEFAVRFIESADAWKRSPEDLTARMRATALWDSLRKIVADTAEGIAEGHARADVLRGASDGIVH